MSRVVISGASGFIGRHVVKQLLQSAADVIALTRRSGAADASPRLTHVAVADVGDADWDRILDGATAVVHLASRPSLAQEDAVSAGEIAAAARLAEAVRRLGVPRCVLVSSVKVHGEATPPGTAWRPDDAPDPQDAYARTKLAIEKAMREAIADRLSVLRLPLVYGPGVTGNFARLLRAVIAGRPLPVPQTANARSLVYVDNAADAVVRAISAPQAAGRVLLVADDETPSTAQLVRAVAAAAGRPARVLPIPAPLLRAGLALIGRSDAFLRLTGSLVVDAAAAKHVLGWRPTISLAEGLAETCRWFARTHAEGQALPH